MHALRPIAVHASLVEEQLGPGFRAVGLRGQIGPHLDPWIGVDHFHMAQPTFKPHPHSGFSAVTYLFPDSPGAFLNRDSLGDRTRIGPGAFHWTQAGSGVIHEEVPETTGVAGHGLQMFVNLSAEHELVAPRSFHLEAEQIPEVEHDGARLRVLAGDAFGVRSSLDQLLTPVTLLDIALLPGGTLHLPVPLAHHAWALVIAGAGPGLAQHDAVGFGDGDTVELVAGTPGLHVVLGHGSPIGKAVLWDRSLSMSTADRLADARRRHDAGEMGRLDPSF